MLFSAHYKMSLYENTFGFTRLRIYVHLFMVLLIILIIIASVGIWNKKIPIAKCIIILSLFMYGTVNYINVDGLIARENIKRYRETNTIDIMYLTNLSNDALPEIIKLENDSNSTISTAIKLYLYEQRCEPHDFSWYEFNYSKYRANKLLR